MKQKYVYDLEYGRNWRKGLSTSGVYCLKNIIDGKVYVGSGVSLRARRSSHISKLRHNCHINSRLQSAFNQFGSKCFIFEVLEFTNKSQLRTREQYWIDHFKSSNKEYGYNMNPYSDSRLGTVQSEESLIKLRNRIFTSEMRSNMSIAQKNKKLDPDYKIEIYKKISQSQKGKTSFNVENATKAKWIPIDEFDINGNFIRSWNSIKEAAAHFNCNYNIISYYLRGITKSNKTNRIWKYHNLK